MKMVKVSVIIMLMLCFTSFTYCAFSVNVSKQGTIITKELSSTFLNNADLLTKVKSLDSNIVSIDKTTDLNRSLTEPNVALSNDNLVSTQDSSVPIFLWVDNGTIYYYTIAENIDINNN